MRGLEELRQAAAQFLREQGVDAVTAWDSQARMRRKGPVTVVSLRGCEGGPAGLRDYLGEQWNQETRQWEELYGRRAKLTLGLDLYAPKSLGESGCAALFSRMTEVLADGGPAGLAVKELSCGETEYVEQEGLFRCRAEAVCSVYLYAAADEDGYFSDFVVRGTKL